MSVESVKFEFLVEVIQFLSDTEFLSGALTGDHESDEWHKGYQSAVERLRGMLSSSTEMQRAMEHLFEGIVESYEGKESS